MLEYVLTNIFDSPAQTLVNTVNTVGVMGKGIAAEFKRRYPEMFRRYQEHCRTGSLDIGKLSLYKSDNKWVLNFPTKKHWRNPSKLEFVEAGLKKFVASYSAHGITSVSFPQLGAGNGGLDWKRDVKPLMDSYLSDLAIPVFIHVARKDESFVPEHLGIKAKRDLLAPRASVGFEDFFKDLTEVADGVLPIPSSSDLDHPAALPTVQLGLSLWIPGDYFASLWDELRHRVALKRSSKIHPLLSSNWDAVIDLLLRLEYIESIDFEGDPGIRFAPKAATEVASSSTFTVTEGETISR